jgi:2-methylcitrate dehydratase PrpD
VLALRARSKIDPAKIKEVTVVGGHSTYELSQPPELKRKPRSTIDAQFSVPYVVAVAILSGRITVDDFTEAAIKRPEVLRLAQKITTNLDESFDRHGVGPSSLTITMVDGATYKEHVEFCLGSVERPMSLDDIARKFRECAPGAVKPLKKAAIEKVIKLVGRLEELDDATEIIRLVG